MMTQEEIKAMIDAAVAEQVNQKMAGLQAQLSALQAGLGKIQQGQPKDKVTILVTSHELDKLLPSFIIGIGAASFGMEVCMFFTFWGINAMKERNVYEGKNIMEKMLTFMLPAGPHETIISRMNMMGMGTFMMKEMMKQRNVESLPDMINLASELGAKLMACQMTMGIMGISKEELRSGIEYGGVATYIEEAAESKINLVF